MPWYRTIVDDTAIADHFYSVWLAKGSPKDAALFGIKDARHMKYEYYFNPEAALLDLDFVQRVARQCDTPDIRGRGLVLVVGHQNKLGGND
jgi:hypothetical protein